MAEGRKWGTLRISKIITGQHGDLGGVGIHVFRRLPIIWVGETLTENLSGTEPRLKETGHE